MSEQKNQKRLLVLPVPTAVGRRHLLLFFVVAVTLEIKTAKLKSQLHTDLRRDTQALIQGKNPAWHGGGRSQTDEPQISALPLAAVRQDHWPLL